MKKIQTGVVISRKSSFHLLLHDFTHEVAEVLEIGSLLSYVCTLKNFLNVSDSKLKRDHSFIIIIIIIITIL